MPNRIIKESICVSEQIDKLSWFEEVLFYRLLVNCDDYGCMDAREKVLTAKLFPLKAIRASEIYKALDKLVDVGLIGLYEVDEKPYLKVLKWADHQRVRISKHKYPEPTEEQLAAGCGNSRQVAANGGKLRPESNPIQSESNPNTNPYPNPNPTRAGARETDSDESFDLFWEAYPKKVAKQDALKAWNKLKPDGQSVTSIMSGLMKWKSSGEWARNDGQFIPHPASWLNGRRWEDDVPVYKDKPSKVVTAQEYSQRNYDNEQDDAMKNMLAMMKREGKL